MRSQEIEDGVRRLSWPEASPELRARVLAGSDGPEPPIAWRARVAADSRTPAGQVSVGRLAARATFRWRQVGAVAAVCLAVVALSCAGLDVLAGREVDIELARLTARFGSLGEDTLNLAPVPAADNRALVVKAASAETVPLSPADHHYIPYRPSDPVPEPLRVFAQANRQAIHVADDVRARRQSNWDVDYRRGTGYPDMQSIRRLSDAILLTAMIDLEGGRSDAAARALATGLGVMGSLRQEPTLAVQVDRMAFMASRHLDAVREILERSEPTEPALAEIASQLAGNRSSDAMFAATLAQVKQMNVVFARMEKGDVDPGAAANIYPQWWPSSLAPYLGDAAQIGRPFVRQARARMLQRSAKVLDILAGPRPYPPLPELENPWPWALADRLAYMFAQGSDFYVKVGEHFNSALGSAEIAVALRRYRLDRGAYPETLTALVPVYLDRLPIDPLTAQPPVYSRQGTGFSVLANTAGQPGLVPWPLEWRISK